MASAGPWGYLRRLRSFGSGVWVFWIRDATTVRMVRFVRSAIFGVRPRPGAGLLGSRDKTTLAAATAHVRSASRLVSAPIVNLRPVLPAASLCCALLCRRGIGLFYNSLGLSAVHRFGRRHMFLSRCVRRLRLVRLVAARGRNQREFAAVAAPRPQTHAAISCPRPHHIHTAAARPAPRLHRTTPARPL